MSTCKISITNLQKSFEHQEVIHNFNFNINTGEVVAFIGKSGCGKSTLFECISDLIDYNGQIIVDGNIGYVNQKSVLLPWYTLEENVNLIRKIGGLPKIQAVELQQSLKLFNLNNKADQYPEKLSGGEKQRAAIMLNHLTQKDIWLLDEPFSSLDMITKETLYKWLREILKTFNKTVLLITHDIFEAIHLADKIVILESKGMGIKEVITNTMQNFNKEYILNKLNH